MKMASLTTDKKALRRHFLELRSLLPRERRNAAAKALASALSPLFSKPVLSFVSFRSEIDMLELNTQLASQHLLVLPRIEGLALIPYYVDDLSTLIPNEHGLLEPDPEKCQRAHTDEIALILVPALAFDQRGHRLGYGKGLYDRFLRPLPQKKIGVGFQEQLANFNLPADHNDVPLDTLCLK